MENLYALILEAQADAHNGNLSLQRTIAMMDLFREYLEADASQRQKVDIEAGKRTLRTAIAALTFSEMQALTAVMRALPPEGGLVVAGQVAETVGITRSVIVSALRKLESAGIIEARSLGMKGTHIKVLVPGLRDQLLSVA